jgi:hypothetical protein
MMSELPYGMWREYDPEDTLRFWALRLRELDLIERPPTKSSPRARTGAFSTSSSAN